jgi:NADPH:quinone reductase
MKAIQITRFGGPEVLEYVDVPDPEPGPGEILVRVEAVSVNWSDTMRRSDAVYPFPTRLPFIPGGEVAGTVEALGDGVDGPPVGTPVFALVGADGSGGYAQFAVAAAVMVIPRPPTVSTSEAAAIMVAGGTAMVMLEHAARLLPGESLLVEGAGGGVGTYAIQIAKAMEAGVVIGAAGSEPRRELARTVGADHVIDYGDARWPDQLRDVVPHGVDVALQCTGAATMSGTLASLAPFGRMVVYGYASGTTGALTAADQEALFYRPVLNQSVSGFNIGLYFGLRPDVAVPALTRLIEFVAAGTVVPHIGAVLPLADAAHAHRLLEARGTVGKVILQPW